MHSISLEYRSLPILALMFLTTSVRSDDDADLRPYIEASGSTGGALRGRAVFTDARSACARCHGDDATGGAAGPDLSAVGDKYDRAALAESILRPSKDILPGYRAQLVLLDDGTTHSGILKLKTLAKIVLVNSDGSEVEIERARVRAEESLQSSLMPENLHRTMRPNQFADLLSYLETLRQPSLQTLSKQGMPAAISKLEHSIAASPIHREEQRFDKPVWLSPHPTLDNMLVILEHRSARIWLLSADGEHKTLFADLSADVSDGPWEGLVSIAFHPDFASNHRYFLKHETKNAASRRTLVVERRATDDGRRDARHASRVLLAIDQPADNHNGGTAIFGPDGYLYVCMGDGGPQEDPNGYSQSYASLLGAMLRIDVDTRTKDLPYGIPPTNPWLESPSRRPEIWAIGFREPWRFSFDAVTGDLWLGDVGQGRFEEVTIVRAAENHGWNVIEGFVPFSEKRRREGEIYTPPVFAYGRKQGVSVTGGYVYRADASSPYYGAYIFGDYESRRIWSLRQSGRRLDSITEIGRSPQRIASFGLDAAGEMYVVGYEGTIFRLHLAGRGVRRE